MSMINQHQKITQMPQSRSLPKNIYDSIRRYNNPAKCYGGFVSECIVGTRNNGMHVAEYTVGILGTNCWCVTYDIYLGQLHHRTCPPSNHYRFHLRRRGVYRSNRLNRWYSQYRRCVVQQSCRVLFDAPEIERFIGFIKKNCNGKSRCLPKQKIWKLVQLSWKIDWNLPYRSRE